ncbi:hypothetical protein ROE7235_01366 [Roseibaca ekhonensis]|uniref:Uncharacterized protein n=1 Tax=Roseinatronobacter ekhonensis TaxID=254356 RepID=A0A3B0MUW0_9RHOB|nr:hypothetical protein [Roseibaca ekhonensis]SUZ31616.1 hypothetical protein ROE7235_01366 [Roseibaca ekhonensis]
MTALDKYRKLEGIGLWSARVEDQRREVVVNFGDATLVISDSRSMQVLSHWSLPAVRRHNPRERPALYSPEGDGAEVLELEDDWLIDALEEVQAALAPPRRWRDRLGPRSYGVLGLLTLAGVALVFPPALKQHTADVLPWTTRHEIGTRLADDLQSGDTVACSGAQGRAALDALHRQVLDQPVELRVVQGTARPRVTGFPGGVYVIDARLLDMADSAEALAGALLLAEARLRITDPVRPVLDHIGTFQTLGLLTSGAVPTSALTGYADAHIRAPAPLPEAATLLSRFAALDLSSRPFADNPEPLDLDADALLAGLRAGDPMAGQTTTRALLSDGQWVSLQNICAF